MSGFGSQVGCGGEVKRAEHFHEGGGRLGVDVPGGTRGGLAELQAQVAEFGRGVGEQAGNLGFKGAGTHNLPEGCVGGQWEQVTGDVEGARFQRAFVSVGLEGFRAGDAAAQGLKNSRRSALVGSEKILYGFAEELRRL